MLPPAEQQQVADALEDDAEVMTQHPARGAARRPTRGDPGRDHPHQHRRATARPSGRAAHPDPRRPPRAVQLVPHDAPTRPQAIGLRRRDGLGLTRSNLARFVVRRTVAVGSGTRCSTSVGDEQLEQDHTRPRRPPRSASRRAVEGRAAGTPCHPPILGPAAARWQPPTPRWRRSWCPPPGRCHQQRQQWDIGGADHRPDRGQGRSYMCPCRQAAGVGVLAEQLGIAFGGPVHEQGDHHRDRQRHRSAGGHPRRRAPPRQRSCRRCRRCAGAPRFGGWPGAAPSAEVSVMPASHGLSRIPWSRRPG